LGASLKVVVGRGAEFEMALLVVREAGGWDRRVSEVATGDVEGWASNLQHRCVHRLDAAAVVSGGACSVVGTRDERVGGTSRKA